MRRFRPYLLPLLAAAVLLATRPVTAADLRTSVILTQNDAGTYRVKAVSLTRNNSAILFSLEVTPPQPKPLPDGATPSSLVTDTASSLRYEWQEYHFVTQCDRPPRLELSRMDYWRKAQPMLLGEVLAGKDTFWEAEPGTIGGEAFKAACELMAERAKFYSETLPSAAKASK